jgi:hypothetical protein
VGGLSLRFRRPVPEEQHYAFLGELGCAVFAAPVDRGQHESGVESHKEDHGTDMLEDIEVPFLWANNDDLKRILMKR